MSFDPHNPDPRGTPNNGAALGGMDAREAAELYAAGALSAVEQAEFERRLAAQDREFVAAFAAVRPALEALLSAEAVTPPTRVRDAVMRQLDTQDEAEEDASAEPLWSSEHGHDDDAELVGVGAGGGAAPGIAITRAASGRWHRTGVRGVKFRQLHADRRNNRRTIMLHMAPGSSLPDHDHAGDEEVIMLTGDLSIAGTTLGPGDHIRISPGARHGVPRTTGGCTCIVVSAYVPFPLTSWPGFVWTAVKGLFARPKKPTA